MAEQYSQESCEAVTVQNVTVLYVFVCVQT
jgi:hypothetical protein